MKKFTYFKTMLLAIMLLVGSGSAWGQIAAWQLYGKTGSETSIDASTLNSNLNTSTLTRGVGLNASALANVFGSTNFTTSGTKADAITNNKYITFNIKAKSGFQVSLSTLDVRFRRSSTGPNAFRWQYSLDGSTFTDLGSADIGYTLTTTGGDAQTQISLSGITALQNVSSSTSIIFRLYGWGATATSGTFGIGRSLTSGATDYSLAIGGSVATSGATATPTFSLTSGTYTSAQNVTLSSTTSDAKIYYTTDGVTTPSSASTPYTGAIALNSTATTTIQAIAYDASNANPSSVASATYTINLNPTINSTPSTLSAFSAVVGTPYSKTLTVSGTNLTTDISASLDDATQFQVSPATVTQSGGTAASTTVTVTYNPTAAGTHTATLTLSSGSATTVTYLLSGTATWPPLDTPVATAATSLNTTSVTANWNTVANATEYTLNVYTKSGTKFSEGFDNVGSTGTPVPTDWTFTNIGATYTSTGYYNTGSPSLKFDNTGDIVETPTYSTPATSISFWIRGASTDATSSLLVEGSTDGSTWSTIENINPLPTSGTLKTYNSESTPALAANIVKFRFTYTKSAGNLAFDDFVFDHNYLETPISGSPFTGITDLTKTLSSLIGSTAYYYTVTANNTHVTSSASNEITAITAINSSVVASTLPDCATCDVTVANGGTLTVDAVKTYNSITVAPQGKLTNSSTLTVSAITIQSDAIGTGTIVGDVTGTATVNQYLSSYRTWYMSSPVSNVAPSNMDRYKFYDETTNTWPTVAPAQTIGAGFLAVPTNNTVTSTSFSGSLNNGAINIPLSYTPTAAKAGFNLVGNPYPSYLDWMDVYANNIDNLSTSTLWYRTKSGTYTFWTVNGVSGEVSPSEASKYIPPMQAFWVRTASVSKSLNLANTLRKHAPDGGSLLKAPAVNSNTLIRLEVSNGTNTDEAVLYFNDNAGNGFDPYDSPKMSNEDVTIPEILTRAGNEQLVINGMQTMPKDTEIALGFEAGNASSFSLRANELRNLPSDVKVILKDNVTNVETDLTDGASYAFEPIATTADRFSVIFRTAGSVTNIDQPNYSGSIVAYSNAKNQLTVLYNGAIDANTTVSVYNSVGQRMISKGITSKTTVIDGAFSSGVYVVKVNNMTHKVVLK